MSWAPANDLSRWFPSWNGAGSVGIGQCVLAGAEIILGKVRNCFGSSMHLHADFYGWTLHSLPACGYGKLLSLWILED